MKSQPFTFHHFNSLTFQTFNFAEQATFPNMLNININVIACKVISSNNFHSLFQVTSNSQDVTLGQKYFLGCASQTAADEETSLLTQVMQLLPEQNC